MLDHETGGAFELKELNSRYCESDFEVVDQIYPGLFSYVLYYNPEAFPLLNIGDCLVVRVRFGLGRLFFGSIVRLNLSFATMSLLEKAKQLKSKETGL